MSFSINGSTSLRGDNRELYRNVFYDSLPPIMSRSSNPAMPAGNVFKLYLSFIWSPGRFLVQNLLE